MGYTLDQLLDETGVTDLGNARMAKKASPERHNFSKLAERCRRAAEATADDEATSEQHELAEKTAAIAIISRTIEEIRAIDEGGTITKEAAPVGDRNVDLESFIKAALDKGHSPDAIAAFLDKTGGLLSRAKGAIREFSAGRSLAKAEQLGVKAEAAGGKAFRKWEDHVRQAENLSPDQQASLISRMRVKLNDDRAAKLIAGSKALSNHPAGRDLRKAVDAVSAASAGAAPKALGVNIGGAHAGITSEQLNKLKKPAALVGAGYLGHRALTSSGGDDDKKKSGVVVVNS